MHVQRIVVVVVVAAAAALRSNQAGAAIGKGEGIFLAGVKDDHKPHGEGEEQIFHIKLNGTMVCAKAKLPCPILHGSSGGGVAQRSKFILQPRPQIQRIERRRGF